MNPAALRDYATLLTDIKTRMRGAQVHATLAANAEMLVL